MTDGQRKPPRPETSSRSSHMRSTEPFPEAADRVTVANVHEQVGLLSERVDALTLSTDTLIQRFDTFHGELSLIRSNLVDLAPRVTDSERRLHGVEKTGAEKAKGLALGGVRLTVYTGFAIAVLGALAKQWPWLQAVADALKGISF